MRTMPDTLPAHDLLVVDSLQGMVRTAPLAPAVVTPEAAPNSVADIMRKLAEWQGDFVAGRSSATIRAVRADWAQYIAWCESTGQTPLPAPFEQLEAFLRHAIVCGRKRSTIDRYLYTVTLVHQAAGLPSPTADARWKNKWKILVRELGTRGGNKRTQAGQLVATDIERIVSTLGTSKRDLRDAAMLLLASDTLLRESELVRVEVAHFEPNAAKGTFSLYVPFSKTNQSGEDEDYRHVDADTMAAVQRWLDAAGITEGVVFRPIGGRKRAAVKVAEDSGNTPPVVPLGAQEVARIFRRRAVSTGLDHALTVSGHSTRVGSANDLINQGFTTAQIQDAGRWKSPDMVQLYTRRSQAGANAVADLRRKQKASRDSVDR